MAIRSARRVSLVSTVMQGLREFVQEKKLQSGDRLPTEAELLARFNVSRSVLREAIGRLDAIGVVSVRHGQGMFVGDPSAGCRNLLQSAMAISSRDLTQFAELLTALECHSARRAAELARREDVEKLEIICDRMDRPGLPSQEMIRDDFTFHQKLAEITGNTLLLNTVTVLQQFIIAGMRPTAPKLRARTSSRRLHRMIVKAVEAGDPAAAEDAIREQIRVRWAVHWQLVSR